MPSPQIEWIDIHLEIESLGNLIAGCRQRFLRWH